MIQWCRPSCRSGDSLVDRVYEVKFLIISGEGKIAELKCSGQKSQALQTLSSVTTDQVMTL